MSVDGFTYEITQLDGWRGFTMSSRILGKMSGAFAPLASMLSGGDQVKNMLTEENGAQKLAPAFESLMAKLPPDEMLSIAEELFKTVRVQINGSRTDVLNVFNDHFQGRAASVYKLIWKCIEVNFLDFGKGRGVLGVAPQTQNPSVSGT